MGRWSEDLFGGDTDLDEASYISEDAGIELYMYEIDPEYPDERAKGLEATRAHLNSGVLDKLFVKYAAAKATAYSFVSKELRLVFLGAAALAMRVGATISPDQMALLRVTYTKIDVAPKYSLPFGDTGFRAPAKKQFETALRLYKNDGSPYNFNAVRCEADGCGKSQHDMPEGQTLMKCGKCKLEHYCSRECQAASWPDHKKCCKTPEKREAEEKRRWGNGPMMMNV
ncbi:SET and MYND domain-containing protein [Lachnellula suecica]|uniref:SET and MYND domain-containing protein n=1 Tax=Lachnellula suecica TaxID=602035 RepID=A0A8T9CIT6_9HELO|nr:SET and MYND domain-containing protein [Lachnellula suecica]